MLRATSLIITSLAISCGAAIADPVVLTSQRITAASVEVPLPPPRPIANRLPVAQKVVRGTPVPAVTPEQRVAYRTVEFPSVGSGF